MEDQLLLWTKVTAVGQVVGSAATAAAVITSLWVVLSERAARVTADVGLRLLIAGDGSDAEEVVVIRVTNIGQRPVRVSAIGWRTGWLNRFGPKWAQRQYAFQKPALRQDSQDPPYLLEPGEERAMFIGASLFQGEERVRRNEELFGRVFPILGLIPANIQCSVSMVGARTMHFPIEKPLAKFLISGESSALEKFNGTHTGSA